MLKEILIEQNIHWQEKKYSSTKRKKLDKLISYLPLRQIVTVTGIRRCGKSTLLKQAINYLIENGTDPVNILFLNLEHPYFLDYKTDPKVLESVYEEYLKLIAPKGKIYIFFDEIQYISNWQVYVKNRYENSDIKFIITGSNSSMLSSELNTLLSGRSLNIHLDTFDFSEYLDYLGIEHNNEFDRIKNKIDIARAKEKYLKWGGFYEVFDVKDETLKKEILVSYAKNIIYQDIVPRYKIRNTYLLERLFFYLLSLCGNIVNYTKLSKIFEISDKSIKEYINYFEDVFLFKKIDKYHTKEAQKIKSNKKLYTLDNGFLQIYPKHSLNNGVMLENAVFNVLNQKGCYINYFKENYEIDFVIDDKLLQVSYDMNDEKTLKREIRAFGEFKFDREKLLITYNKNTKIQDLSVVSFDNFALDEIVK